MATQNSINNKSSQLTIDPGASGDSFIQFDINGTGEFRIGVDDTDDSFRISQGSSLGTNDTFVMTADGERTLPIQPAFLSVVTSTITNVTGSSGTYSVVFGTEIFDQGGDFSSTTFTAPITGRYRFEVCTLLGGVTASHTGGSYRLNVSNDLILWQIDVGSYLSATNSKCPLYVTTLIDMDASDTAKFDLALRGGAQSIDIESNGSTDPQSWFSGNLEE